MLNDRENILMFLDHPNSPQNSPLISFIFHSWENGKDFSSSMIEEEWAGGISHEISCLALKYEWILSKYTFPFNLKISCLQIVFATREIICHWKQHISRQILFHVKKSVKYDNSVWPSSIYNGVDCRLKELYFPNSIHDLCWDVVS